MSYCPHHAKSTEKEAETAAAAAAAASTANCNALVRRYAMKQCSSRLQHAMNTEYGPNSCQDSASPKYRGLHFFGFRRECCLLMLLSGEWLRSQGYMTAQRRTWRSAVATANCLGFDVDILQAYEQQA